MRRQYGGWRRFELTGHVTPMHSRRSSTWSAAFRARLRNCRRRMHTRGGRDGATGGGHRSSGVTPRGFPVGRTSMGRRGGGEAEGCPRRGDRAGRHLGPTRRTLPCSVGCTAPQQARGPQARRRRALLRPTRRLRHRDYHRPSASGRGGPAGRRRTCLDCK